MHYNYSTSTREASVCFVLSVVVIYFYPSCDLPIFCLGIGFGRLGLKLGQAGFYH